MATVVTKPTEFFHPDPNQPRRSFPEDELRELGASLKKKQIIPLIARNSGMIVDGERRWRAAKLISLASLDVIVLPDDATEGEVKTIQLVTALQRADLTPHDLFCGFKSWLELHPGATAKVLADSVSRSEATVSMTLSLAKCVPAVQEAAAQGKIGLKDWYAISQVPEADQPVLLAAKLGGASAGELKRLRKKPKDGVRVARVKCEMGSGVVVTLAGVGEGLALDDVIATLSELLKEAKKANDQGLNSKTFSAALKCRKEANHVRVG